MAYAEDLKKEIEELKLALKKAEEILENTPEKLVKKQENSKKK